MKHILIQFVMVKNISKESKLNRIKTHQKQITSLQNDNQPLLKAQSYVTQKRSALGTIICYPKEKPLKFFGFWEIPSVLNS